MTSASELLRQAQSLAESCPTWADLSNALYDPIEGLLSRAFSTREERRCFVQTVEYREIQKVLANAVERHGLLEGATPKRITEYMVQLHLAASNDDSNTAKVQFENLTGERSQKQTSEAIQ